MARPKKVKEEDRRSHVVRPKLIHLVGVEFHDDRMRAVLAFGRTPDEAVQHAKNAIQRLMPRRQWDTTVELVNPEVFERAGVSFELQDDSAA